MRHRRNAANCTTHLLVARTDSVLLRNASIEQERGLHEVSTKKGCAANPMQTAEPLALHRGVADSMLLVHDPLGLAQRWQVRASAPCACWSNHPSLRER